MNATSALEPTVPGSLFRGYRPPPGVYDELLDAGGRVRAHWQQFLQLLNVLGTEELERRWQQARRLIHEHGVAYNVHGDPQGRDRRWDLDALPLLLPHAEWTALARGLAQRARLLDALLADVYGPQRMLREGALPAALVFANSGFLRPCHGTPPEGGRHLYLYAAHVARSPEGQWWVVADRTQAPVGPGYAVENRIVISRMLPHLFHHCRVERLAGFFMSLREALGTQAGRRRDGPHIALLSPGPTSPTYFEDSYLARYLGYTLVEGEDLTVRDNRVFLKTLGGLVAVDALLRRVADDDCDALELAGRSNRGVPGLLHAVRGGDVLVANAVGSGLVEARGLMAFLPELCRRLLGEELELPSVRTWWCGDAESRTFVLDSLERLLVSELAAPRDRKPVCGASLDPAARQALAAAILAAPDHYVAEELIVRSTAPVWSDGAPAVGHVALRAFVTSANDGYQAMPGALAHVSASPQSPGETPFAGHGSKDVWVLADGPVAPLSLLQPPGTPIRPRRSGIDLPSRVADNLFWLGRHVERAEGTVRLLRSICGKLISEAAPGSVGETTILYRALAGASAAAGQAEPNDASVTALEQRVLAFLYDEHHPGSLQTILHALARVAGIVRDRISLDSWRILKRVDDDFRLGYPLGVVSLADVLAMLNQMILNFSAFGGVATENMTRGPGWQFLELGRRIERALDMIGLLRRTLFRPAGNEHALFESLLEIADSSMTYRSRYAASLQAAPLLDLLVTDETNPRAIAFQLAALANHVERLPRPPADPLLSDEQRLVLTVLSAIRLADAQTLAETNEQGQRRQLDTLLAEAGFTLGELASSITHKYLVHAGPAHQLAEIGWV